MDGWLERLPLALKAPGSTTLYMLDLSKTLSVHLAVNGYPTLFRVGEGEGGEEK